MPRVNAHCTCDQQLHEWGKNKFTEIKHIYHESANLIQIYGVAFDTNDRSNLAEMVPVIGMKGMVTCTHHH